MEGPTPVSALIHAATMVTAGIFLIARLSPLMQYSYYMLNLIVIFGIITSIIFSFSGQNTNDLKKIVASSTASQLAYMFFISGLLDVEASIFHLFLHAFFKALLFLSAGAIIHGLADQQDVRKMGGLFLLMPFNTFCFAIGSLSLIGMPAATGGFYSKDPIVENTLLFDNYFDDFLNLSCELGVINTLYYNLKLLKLVFFGHYKGPQNFFIHDSNILMVCCLFFLVLCSFVAPLFWEFIMSEDNMFSQTFSQVNNFYKEGDLNFYREEEIVSFLFWLIFLICCFGLIHSESFFSENFDNIANFSTYIYYEEIVVADNIRWGLEYLMVKKLNTFFYNLSDFFFFTIDRGILELFGPLSIVKFISKFFFFLSELHTGFIYNYVIFYLVGFFSFLVLFFSNMWYTFFFFLFFLFFFWLNKKQIAK
jgi:NADH:ubiquinone oxidoreductase subunit 5 (subunit L)/multisubunit Na+/H+ antiporter MnhA subunit